MYVKIRLENGQWFQEDTGAFVGDVYSYIPQKITLIDSNGKTIELKYGYINSEGCFVHLCQDMQCSYNCLAEQRENCRYVQKAASEGIYLPDD